MKRRLPEKWTYYLNTFYDNKPEPKRKRKRCKMCGNHFFDTNGQKQFCSRTCLHRHGHLERAKRKDGSIYNKLLPEYKQLYLDYKCLKCQKDMRDSHGHKLFCQRCAEKRTKTNGQKERIYI